MCSPAINPAESLVRVRRGERQCDIYVIGIISELRAAQRASQDAALLGGPLPVDLRVPPTTSGAVVDPPLQSRKDSRI
jgi:hypothetical protein